MIDFDSSSGWLDSDIKYLKLKQSSIFKEESRTNKKKNIIILYGKIKRKVIRI